MLNFLLNIGVLAQTGVGTEQADTNRELVSTPIAPGEGSWWLPPQVTTNAASTDVPFYFTLWISAVAFFLIVGVMLYLAIRYRRRSPGQEAEPGPANDAVFQLVWIVIPLVLFMDMFYLGFRGYMDVSHAPSNAMSIVVGAKDSKWSFKYPDGHIDESLHVPVNQPVLLTMESDDSIHSLSIPAFRLKRDVLPGRSTTAWFEACDPGEYALMCAKFCGAEHSDHWSQVIVHGPGEYEKWQEQAGGLFKTHTMVEVGEMMYTKYACATCHTLDGTTKIGPSFKGLFGRESLMTGGNKIVVDEKYISTSVLDPQADLVAGYPPAMPSFKGMIKDRELEAIIEYMKTLSESANETEVP